MFAKLTAAAIFTFAVTLILFASDMVYFQLIYGFDGFSAPIYALQEFEMCPFNITLFGALVITFVLRLVFLLMFTFLVTAVSSFAKRYNFNGCKRSGGISACNRLGAAPRHA